MIRVTAMVESDDPAAITRAIETLGRAVAGLVLEGVDAAIGCSSMPAEGLL